jgi:hypothetical protein
MSRQAYKPAPADVLLELLRENRLDYRCHEQYGRWTAQCPACGERHLDIREHGDRGRVSLRCATGCDTDEVLQRLKHPGRCYDCGAVHGQAEWLARRVDELLELANAQQRLLQNVLAETDDLRIPA